MFTRIRQQRFAAVAAAAGIITAVPIAGHAQEAEGGIEEITVTARKQEESLFEVPVAVSVLTEDFFEVSGFNEVEEIVRTSTLVGTRRVLVDLPVEAD